MELCRECDWKGTEKDFHDVYQDGNFYCPEHLGEATVMGSEVEDEHMVGPEGTIRCGCERKIKADPDFWEKERMVQQEWDHWRDEHYQKQEKRTNMVLLGTTLLVGAFFVCRSVVSFAKRLWKDFADTNLVNESQE